jgi:hypothetical protein
MIEKKDIKLGAEVWYGFVQFSENHFKMLSHEFPKKYTIKDIKIDPPGWGCIKDIITLLDSKGKTKDLYNILLRYDNVDKPMASTFYETENEAIDAWNAIVLNKIDQLDSFYQTKKNYLVSKMKSKK